MNTNGGIDRRGGTVIKMDKETADAMARLGVNADYISAMARRTNQNRTDQDRDAMKTRIMLVATKAAQAPAMTIEKAFNTMDKRLGDLNAECKALHRELAYARLPIEDHVLMALNRQPRAVHVSPTMCKATLAADDAPRSGAAELVETVQRLVENVAQSRYQV